MAEMKENVLKKKGLGFWNDFKAFITRGNVLDMAIGVIMATAFNAIVTAIVSSVLMPLVAAAVPGGFDGLVTVLNHDKAVLTAAEAAALAEAGGKTVEYWGITYNASIVNVINWGAVINAFINFLVIAFTMFLIVKIASGISKKRAELKAKMLEDYYKKHPEERPAPAEPDAPKPTELDILVQIRDMLKEQQTPKEK